MGKPTGRNEREQVSQCFRSLDLTPAASPRFFFVQLAFSALEPFGAFFGTHKNHHPPALTVVCKNLFSAP